MFFLSHCIKLMRLSFIEKAVITYELQHEISNNVVCATSKGSDQPAHTRSLLRAFCSSLEQSMSAKLLTEHNLEFLNLKGGSTGTSESTLVKMPRCWKSHVAGHSSNKKKANECSKA